MTKEEEYIKELEERLLAAEYMIKYLKKKLLTRGCTTDTLYSHNNPIEMVTKKTTYRFPERIKKRITEQSEEGENNTQYLIRLVLQDVKK